MSERFSIEVLRSAKGRGFFNEATPSALTGCSRPARKAKQRLEAALLRLTTLAEAWIWQSGCKRAGPDHASPQRSTFFETCPHRCQLGDLRTILPWASFTSIKAAEP
jgi:hypothetical protein